MRPLPSISLTCITAFVALTGNLAVAQDWLSQTIAATDRTHDFGTVARAAKTEHRFTIKNPFDSELRLAGIRASCGCTTPIIETKVIPPGGTGTILARFNTGTFTGQKQATLTVTIDRPRYTELQLVVRGYIRSDVVMNPGEVQFGQVDQGSPHSVDVALDYAGRSDWAVTRIESPSEFVSAQFEEVSRQAGRIKYKINVEISPDAPSGFLQNQLVLHTNDRRLTTVPLSLYANIQNAIQVSPQMLELGTLTIGEPMSKRLVVKAKQPFRVLEVNSETLNVQFEQGDQAKKVHMLNLQLAPKAGQTGEIESRLEVLTDASETPISVALNFEASGQTLTNTQISD